MVPTERLAHELGSEGFERLVVVARGVDSDRFSPEQRSEALRREWGADPDTLVVIGVGRLATEKNLGLLVDAFEAIRAVRPNARLVMVGDGPERRSLEVRCPHAVFAGRRYEDDLARHYASADVLLFPSVTETFGNVTVEGMASGLAVIAFDYGAAHEWIRPAHNGWTVRVGDSAAFLRTAEGVAKDMGAVRRAGRAARETALTNGWGRILAQLEHEYRAAVRGPAVGGEGDRTRTASKEANRARGLEPTVAVGAMPTWFPSRARLDAPGHDNAALHLGRRRSWQRASGADVGRLGADCCDERQGRTESHPVSTRG